MTATAGFKGFGSTLKWGGEYIAACRDIPIPNMTRDKIDFTNQDSASEVEEFKPGLIHPGEISVDMIFVPGDTDGQVAAIADFLAGTVGEMIITAPTAAGFTWTCNGYVVGVNGTLPYNGEIVVNLTIALTGLPSLSISASTGLTTTFFSISESAVIVPDPAAATYEYVATVLTGVTSVTVTPIATAGVITVDGNVVATGEASSAITLGAAGTVTDITIVVKETGKTAKTYVIHLARAASE